MFFSLVSSLWPATIPIFLCFWPADKLTEDLLPRHKLMNWMMEDGYGTLKEKAHQLTGGVELMDILDLPEGR